MPKIQPTFPSMNDVPAELKEYYRENNGRAEAWIEEDAGFLVQPALVRNRDDIKREKETEKSLKEQAQSQLAETTRQLNDLQSKQSTSKAVSPEDFTLLEEIKKHGELPAIKEKLEKYPQLELTVTKTEREKKFARVRELAGFTNERIFNDLANHPEYAKGFDYVIESVKEGDNLVDKAYLTFKNASGVDEKHEVRAFAESNENWKPYLPLLTQKTEQQQNSDVFGGNPFGQFEQQNGQTGQQTGGNQSQQSQQTGGNFAFPASFSTQANQQNTKQTSNFVDNFIDNANKKRAEAPNPFAPPKAA